MNIFNVDQRTWLVPASNLSVGKAPLARTTASHIIGFDKALLAPPKDDLSNIGQVAYRCLMPVTCLSRSQGAGLHLLSCFKPGTQFSQHEHLCTPNLCHFSLDVFR